jgi:hypothetical protein
MTDSTTDLLIVTARPDEFDAVRGAATDVEWHEESVDR